MMNFQNWQVLVVEDEPDGMELMQGLLGHFGINSIPAGSAEEALHILETTLPTLILIDLALPGKNGWELLQLMQDDPMLSAIPRVALTAYHTAELATTAITAGFDAYFAKPIEALTFVDELQALVERLN
jgi:two-component system, cell cycle response regulator DivK